MLSKSLIVASHRSDGEGTYTNAHSVVEMIERFRSMGQGSEHAKETFRQRAAKGKEKERQ